MIIKEKLQIKVVPSYQKKWCFFPVKDAGNVQVSCVLIKDKYTKRWLCNPLPGVFVGDFYSFFFCKVRMYLT